VRDVYYLYIDLTAWIFNEHFTDFSGNFFYVVVQLQYTTLSST